MGQFSFHELKLKTKYMYSINLNSRNAPLKLLKYEYGLYI